MQIEYIRRLSGYTSSTDASYFSVDNNSSNSTRRQSELNQSKRLELLRRTSVPVQPKLSIKPSDSVQTKLALESASEKFVEEEKANEILLATSHGVQFPHNRLRRVKSEDEPRFGAITIVNEKTPKIPRAKEFAISEMTPILQ